MLYAGLNSGSWKHLVVPIILGFVHRHVGTLEDIVLAAFVVEKHDHAYACGKAMLDGEVLSFQVDCQYVRHRQCTADLFRNDAAFYCMAAVDEQSSIVTAPAGFSA